MAASASPGSVPLPSLRPDLVFYPGPTDEDGSATFTISDPVSGQYSKIGWREAEVLQRLRPGMTMARLLTELERETTVRISAEEVAALCKQAEAGNLVASLGKRDGETLARVAKARALGPLKWLMHHYLYFRVPLLRPDAFLTRTLAWVLPLASPAALTAYAIVGILGLLMLLSRFGDYAAMFMHYLSWQGALYYGIAVIFAKAVHEFSHAYTAKAFGIRVRSMGVAFMVFWPVPYSDISDAWRLPRRRQRFLIGCAGVAAELALAAVSLFLWCLAPEGAWRSAFFALSTVTLISSLFMNLNPAMRFDGYYLLADAWGIENLRSRAAALARWQWRRSFLGMDLPLPEPMLSAKRRAGMVAYACLAFCYRLAVYIGIAVFVYYKFAKVLGLVLFAIEVWYFILAPFADEARALYGLREKFSWNRRARVLVAVAALFLLWAGLPLPRLVRMPAVVVAAGRQVVYAPAAGQVRDLAVSLDRGMVVEPGQALCRIENREMLTELAIAESERKRLERERHLLLKQEGGEALLAENIEACGKAAAEIASLRQQVEECALRAEIAGMTCGWDETLFEGAYVPAGKRLGEVVASGAARVEAFLPEIYVHDFQPGDRVMFMAAGGARLAGAVRSIVPVDALDSRYYALLSTAGGDLPVAEEAEGRWMLLGSYYRLEIDLKFARKASSLLLPGQSGEVSGHSRPRSLLWQWLKYVWSVVLRESGA